VLDMQLRLDPRDVEAVGRALAAGWRVIACTGRPFPGALPWVERLGLHDPFVCYQGAQVRTTGGEILLARGIPRAVAAEVIGFARERDLHVQVYRDDQLLVERDRPEAHQYADHAQIPITFVPDLVRSMAGVTPKIVIVATAERMRSLLPETQERWRDRLFVTTSLPTFLEMTDLESDKRSALGFLARRLGFEPARAVAVGDGRNDRPMLEWAGLGVAIEGAPPELLEVAGRTIPGPGSGGLAQLLGELLSA
jgi:Cof subfamily protein (haloacid dehalogenase superfamily)